MSQQYTEYDRRRMRWAVAASVVVHALYVAAGGYLWPSTYGGAPGSEAPLVIDLQPQPEPERPREVVASAGPPATQPVRDTNLISDRSTNAQDPQDEIEGRERAPLDMQGGEHLQAGAPPVVVPPPQPAASAVPPVEPQKPEPEAEEKKPDSKPKEVREKPKSAAPSKEPVAVAKVEPNRETADEALSAASKDTESESSKGQEERVEVARREPGAPAPVAAPLGQFRGSVEGGIKGKGVLGLEAKQDEIAPYLLEVRKKVERHWRAAMALRFKGTQPTKAAVECEISPEGKLVRVEIVEAGKVLGFAPLCKESIVKAAPYPKFPFEVPPMFRNKNLEIHWTFEFM